MPKLPPLGTTSGQTARKPASSRVASAPTKGIVPFSDLYQQSFGMPLTGGLPPQTNPAGVAPVVPPGLAQVDPAAGLSSTSPNSGPFFKEPGAAGQYFNSDPERGPQGQIFVDPTAPASPKNDTEAQIEALLKLVQQPLNLEPLPSASSRIVLPPAPQRDVKAEGRDRAKQDSLALLLPLLSLLGTGSVDTGVMDMPGAYSAINQGVEQFQDKAAGATQQNYGANIQNILQQDQLDTGNRNEQVQQIMYRNAQKQQAQAQMLQLTKELLQFRAQEKRLDNQDRKIMGDARAKFLSDLSKLDANGQVSYWQTNKAQADAMGLTPTYNSRTGEYIPLNRNSDLIGYANAKNGADRINALRDIAGDRIDATYAAIDQRRDAAKTAKEIAIINANARKEVQSMANEAAWNRLMEGERNINARFDASDDLKRIAMVMRWHTDMNKPAGQRLTHLFTRNAALQLDRRAAMNAIDGLNKNADKFDDETLKKRIAEQQAIVDSSNRQLAESERIIATLQEEADKGTIDEDFINMMTSLLDRKGQTSGDAGSKALAKSGAASTPRPLGGNNPPRPPAGTRPGMAVPRPRAASPAQVAPKKPAATDGGWVNWKNPADGKTYRIRKH